MSGCPSLSGRLWGVFNTPLHGRRETRQGLHFPGVGKHQTRRESHFPGVGKPQTRRESHFPGVGKPQTRRESHFPRVGSPKPAGEKAESGQPKPPQQLTSKQPRAGCGPPGLSRLSPRQLDGALGSPPFGARRLFRRGAPFFVYVPPHTRVPWPAFPASAEAAGALPDASGRVARCTMRKTGARWTI